MQVLRRRLRVRRVSGAALASLALIFLVPQAARAEPGVPVPPSELIPDKAKGTVAEADKDLVVKVRLAGLWEIPAGQMAQEKSDNPRIREIGRNIADQHEVLDQLARNAAQKLGIDLPDEPNSDQQGWLDEMAAADGEEFDQIYIDRLRAAHGKIFPAIATVRATTRNDTVRRLAQQANQFVATHLTLLESSNIVDFKALPTAPNPNPNVNAPAAANQVVAAANDSQLPTTNLPVILGVLLAGLLVGGFATHRLIGNRRATGNRRRMDDRSRAYRNW